MRPIVDVASDLGLKPEDLITYGPHMAKLAPAAMKRLQASSRRGKLVLVSAMNPTKFGEGKTTTSIGLAQGLRRKGRKVALALREPSLGPIFGVKGGGTGGGQCLLQPSSRINMHFTGDKHAVTSAHNLLAALIDNAIHFGGNLEHRQVLWRRVLDMNDRFLRRIVIGLGGKANGVPREDGFDITAASEVMAVLCLAKDIPDLKARLGRILVGFDREGKPVTADALKATGAMAALLQDALLPNLVQSTEGVPAFVHGGPFGNIAHGCNSILGTTAALASADYAVTEAGFGFDLGAEKFLDIKCRLAGFWPSAAVLVVTVRALRSHGGDGNAAPGSEASMAVLKKGLEHLEQHAAAAKAFGLTPVVSINLFPTDTDAELKLVEAFCAARGLRCARFGGFAKGGEGAEILAAEVIAAADAPPAGPRFLYGLEQDPAEKIRAIVRASYGARDAVFTKDAEKDLERVRKLGYAGLPICMAKTHLSLSDDPSAVGRPQGFEITIRSVRIAAGAGYLLALTGEIMTMPGLPAVPAAVHFDLTTDGQVVGI